MIMYYGGLGLSPECLWISKDYACDTCNRLIKKEPKHLRFGPQIVLIN